jgi:hypothetical protein
MLPLIIEGIKTLVVKTVGEKAVEAFKDGDTKFKKIKNLSIEEGKRAAKACFFLGLSAAILMGLLSLNTFLGNPVPKEYLFQIFQTAFI